MDISINIYRIVDLMAKERGYFMDESIVMRDEVFGYLRLELILSAVL